MPAPLMMPANDVSALMSVLGERWVLALATTAPDTAVPYPTPLFYALAPPATDRAPLLIFASRADTQHGRHLGDGPTAAAAAVYLETETVGELRGVQLRGEVTVCTRLHGERAAALHAAYVARHPGAAPLLLAGRDRLYAFAVTWAKLTDNRLGFGKRLEWTFTPPWSDLGVPSPLADA